MLKDNPQSGIYLGNSCYKIRLAVESKRKGKSGGVRIISYFYFSKDTLYMLAIYDKSEISDITEKEIKALIAEIE